MRVLEADRWRDGFLDYHLAAGSCRVEVTHWLALAPIRGMYFKRERSLRSVMQYAAAIGVRATIRKVRSRSAETLRNQKWFSVGFGTVTESSASSGPAAGDSVVFLATAHPRCVDRVVIPVVMVRRVRAESLPAGPGAGELLFMEADATCLGEQQLGALSGWCAESGASLPPGLTEETLSRAADVLRAADWSVARRYLRCPSPSAHVSGATESRGGGGRPSAVLFGFGNYAKTVLLPAVQSLVDIRQVHEVDPTQIPNPPALGFSWDSAPLPSSDRRFDVWFVAGFHHSHTPLAVLALGSGAAAVVEKPLVTSREQQTALLAAMSQGKGRLFACFNRRFLPFNDLLREDLKLGESEPFSYHCTVYEVPLPRLHWYRWPVSGGRLIANGCHWIDHFLFLSGFAEPVDMTAHAGPDGELVCSLTLRNRSFFTMVLTDKGSDRIGVREHIEVRSRQRTAVIEDCQSYVSEGDGRILRRRRVPRLAMYTRMYREVCRRVVAGEAGDSLKSVRVTTDAVLGLTEVLAERAKAPSPQEPTDYERTGAP